MTTEVNNFNKWTIAEFIETQEVSVIPVGWIFTDENEKTYCYWPNSKHKLRKHIKNAAPYKPDWAQWEIKVLLLESIDSYEKALEIEKEKQFSTDSDNNVTKISDRSSRKRKKLLYDDFVDFTTDSDDNVLFSPSPPKITIISNDSVLSDGSDDTVSVTSTDLMPPPPVPKNRKLSIKQNQTDLLEDEILIGMDTNMNSFSVVKENENLLNVHSHSPSISVDSPFSLDVNGLTVKVDLIYNAVTENKLMLKRIMDHLSKTSVEINSNIKINENCIPSTAPFRKFKEVLLFDQSLKENLDKQKQLETIFYLCGGSTQRDMTVRSLQKIFHNKLAKKCSWYGRKNNFEIGKLKLIESLKDAVRKRFEISDKMFESIIGNWFRQAKLRYMRNLEKERKRELD